MSPSEDAQTGRRAAADRRVAAVREMAARAAAAGASLTLELPGATLLRIGAEPDRTRVQLRSDAAVDALLRGDHMALGEAFLSEQIDVAGDLRQVFHVTEQLDMRPDRWGQLGFWLRFLLDRRNFQRRSIAFHYDRPPDFFLSWLGPARCYTHGFYAAADDTLAAAEERKLAAVMEALALAPGDRVLDMGCGWGCFLERAGRAGVRVHGITISREQHAFVAERIRAERLPCSVELVDFHDFRPAQPFDAVVFMGSLEHIAGYGALTRFLARHLAPHGRVYADFVTSREGRMGGTFIRKYIFPGVSNYVDVPGLVAALLRAGLNLRHFEEDTLSCAWTVRDWALRLEADRKALVDRYGEAAIRAFQLYLWGSHHFLLGNRTQAYHLVAARDPAGLRSARRP